MESETNKNFPFGQQLKTVKQTDRSPKKVFVLGVYPSAVYAQWLDSRGKQIVAALAVASEPELFWRGEGAEEIISKINIPAEVGRLILPIKNLNDSSENVLDELYLKPKGYTQEETWLCDLIPESRINEIQRTAIDKFYKPIVGKYNLPPCTIPDFVKNELDTTIRRREILAELEESRASTIILLGDFPINWFLRFHDERFSKLSDFGDTQEAYGRSHEVIINEKTYNVIPLCHPRQVGKLVTSNSKWKMLHDNWKKNQLSEV